MIKRGLSLLCLYFSTMTQAQKGLNRVIKLKRDDISRTAKLIHDAFPVESTHSWARAVGLQSSNLEYWLREMYLMKPIEIEDIGCFGITFKEDLIGVIISERFPILKVDKIEIEEKEEEKVEVDPLLNYAYSSFDALIDAGKDVVRNELKKKNENEKTILVGYVSWIATNETHRGQGIADELIKIATNSMRDRGYKYSTAFCVSPTATRAFNRQGYNSWKDIKYSEFDVNGNKPFAILPDSLSIMVKKLS